MNNYTETERGHLKAIGSNIRILRQKFNMSQENLAFETQLDRTYVGSVERGERNISVLNIIKIANVLEVPPSELLKEIL